MQKVKNKKNFNVTNFLIIMAGVVITIIVGVFVFIMCSPSFVISEYADLKQVEYGDYVTKEHESYYVFIYSDKFEKSSWCEEIVVEYAELARNKSHLMPIYGYNYDKKGNANILTDLSVSATSEENIVRLVYIKEGVVYESFYTWSDIHNELTLAKNGEHSHDHS